MNQRVYSDDADEFNVSISSPDFTPSKEDQQTFHEDPLEYPLEEDFFNLLGLDKVSSYPKLESLSEKPVVLSLEEKPPAKPSVHCCISLPSFPSFTKVGLSLTPYKVLNENPIMEYEGFGEL